MAHTIRSHVAAPRNVQYSVRLPPFQSLVDDHAAELHRFLIACVGGDDAEDCLQETFLSAMRAYPRLRHADNLRAWLYLIAQRKATDLIRRRQRHPASDIDGVPDARLSIPPAGLPDDGLWGAVRRLPGKQRAALVHRFVFDLAYRDVAERMGVSEEAARQNVSAGLRRLRLEVSR
ncbi:MAG: sigma-70 family RNA polymerase sigma factor [Chloroflexi bacterium]|nr:MAG: sigma-70 family RNA polymerase sigma factor [Chloroflexota bacterium]